MKTKSKSKEKVPEVVHEFLARNGRKGGATTRRLIELGKARAAKLNKPRTRGVSREKKSA